MAREGKEYIVSFNRRLGSLSQVGNGRRTKKLAAPKNVHLLLFLVVEE